MYLTSRKWGRVPMSAATVAWGRGGFRVLLPRFRRVGVGLNCPDSGVRCGHVSFDDTNGHGAGRPTYKTTWEEIVRLYRLPAVHRKVVISAALWF